MCLTTQHRCSPPGSLLKGVFSPGCAITTAALSLPSCDCLVQGCPGAGTLPGSALPHWLELRVGTQSVNEPIEMLTEWSSAVMARQVRFSPGRGRTGVLGPASVGTAPSFLPRRMLIPRDSGAGCSEACQPQGGREPGLTFQSGPSIPHITRDVGSARLSPTLGPTPSLGQKQCFQTEMGTRPFSTSPVRPPASLCPQHHLL